MGGKVVTAGRRFGELGKYSGEGEGTYCEGERRALVQGDWVGANHVSSPFACYLCCVCFVKSSGEADSGDDEDDE